MRPQVGAPEDASGEIVTAMAGPKGATRLVSVEWDGQAMLMFSEDLQERADAIQKQGYHPFAAQHICGLSWIMAVDPTSSEEQRLIAEYHIATERYTAAVGELTQLRATMTNEDYTRLLHIVEDARNDCERVRHSLSKLHDGAA
jgi:hypothetical protein